MIKTLADLNARNREFYPSPPLLRRTADGTAYDLRPSQDAAAEPDQKSVSTTNRK